MSDRARRMVPDPTADHLLMLRDALGKINNQSECICGWHSDLYANEQAATDAYERHRRGIVGG